jgi:hypothetical protein
MRENDKSLSPGRVLDKTACNNKALLPSVNEVPWKNIFVQVEAIFHSYSLDVSTSFMEQNPEMSISASRAWWYWRHTDNSITTIRTMRSFTRTIARDSKLFGILVCV